MMKGVRKMDGSGRGVRANRGRGGCKTARKRPGSHVRRVGKAKIPTRINKAVPKAPLKFYDLRAKKSFTTTNYKTITKKGRRFAVATTPIGGTSWRILGKA